MKKLLAIILATLILLSASACAKKGKEYTDIDWDSLTLSNHLPKPQSTTGKVNYDYDTSLSIDINTDESSYKNYVSECKDFGYTIDSESLSSSYSAFNSDGYKLSLSYYSSLSEMTIYLDAPEEMNEIIWPSNGPATLLPTPKSNIGKEISNSSSQYSVYLSNMTSSDYNEYISECQKLGFDIDFNKGDTYYEAMNESGYDLRLDYEGFNTIYIRIKAPEENTTVAEIETIVEIETTAPASEEPTKSEDNGEMVDGMRVEFKEAMDSYEAYIDEYVDFMNRYFASDDMLSMMSEYNDMLSKYSEMSEAFNEWDSEDMNDAELSYYLDVVTRTTTKMLEIEY